MNTQTRAWNIEDDRLVQMTFVAVYSPLVLMAAAAYLIF